MASPSSPRKNRAHDGWRSFCKRLPEPTALHSRRRFRELSKDRGSSARLCVRRCFLLDHCVASRLHRRDLRHRQFQPLDKPLDARMRRRRYLPPVWLPKIGQLLATVAAKALEVDNAQVAKIPSIRFRSDRRSPSKSSRSRCACRASSSASLGIGIIEHTRGSPRNHASSVRNSVSASITSVFARRARRSTGRLDACIT